MQEGTFVFEVRSSDLVSRDENSPPLYGTGGTTGELCGGECNSGLGLIQSGARGMPQRGDI